MDFSKLKIVIYTCIYGKYNNLRAHVKQNINCDYICFTDDETLKNDVFKVIVYKPLDYYEKKSEINPVNYNIINTILMRSHLDWVQPLKNYDICIYLDANATIQSPNLISETLQSIDINNYDFIISKHPWRSCVYDEASICIGTGGKYKYTDLEKQIEYYKNEGYPQNNGLYWNGFIFYLKPFSEKMTRFYELYTEELIKHTKDKTKYYHPQGQVSLPYVFWKLECHYHVIPNMYKTQHVLITEHNYLPLPQ